jgi:hypothetical protein
MWFTRRTYLNDPTLFLPFCDYPPSEEDLDLHLNKLECKSELLWLSGSQGKKFQMTSPNFCIFMIISPLKRTWLFIWTIQNSLYPRIICTKFDWNWPASSVEDFFQYKHKWIWPLLTPGDHDLKKLESILYEKAFM